MNIQRELELTRKIANERGELLLKQQADGELVVEEGNKVFLLCSLPLDQAIGVKLEEVNW